MKKMAVFTGSNINKNEDEKRIVELMKSGLSRVAAERYVREHPRHKKKKEKPTNSNPKPLPQKIDMTGWQPIFAINSKNKLEGVIIARSSAALHQGYFFVSSTSAEKFLTKRTLNFDSLLQTIRNTIQNRAITPYNENAQYISSLKGVPSVAERRELCRYIERAVSQNEWISTAGFLKQRFKYEGRLVGKQANEFMMKELYKADKTPVPEPEPQPTSLAANQFLDDGVIMQGTKVKAELVSFPPDKAMEEYVIPDYVETISTNAFCGTNELQSIRIGRGVKYIESEAFINNSSLVSITIPDTVKIVDEGAFTRCSSLRIALIKSKSEDISPKLFIDCKNLAALATQNDDLRIRMNIVRQSADSQVKLKTHKVGAINGYPHLGKDEKIVVMGNIYHCLKYNHSIKTMWVNIPIRENGVFKNAPICVFRCKKCKKTFILPDIYEYYLMRYKFADTKLFIPLKFDAWYPEKKQMRHIGSLGTTSILMEMGYNVKESEGLSHDTRVGILKSAIELGIVSKAEVEQRLQYFINYIGAKAGNELARSKWKADLRAIHDMKF